MEYVSLSITFFKVSISAQAMPRPEASLSIWTVPRSPISHQRYAKDVFWPTLFFQDLYKYIYTGIIYIFPHFSTPRTAPTFPPAAALPTSPSSALRQSRSGRRGTGRRSPARGLWRRPWQGCSSGSLRPQRRQGERRLKMTERFFQRPVIIYPRKKDPVDANV